MAELDKLTPYEIACLVMYILLENENKILCTFDDLKQHKFTNDMLQILPQGHFKFPRVIDNKIQNGINLIAKEKGKYKLTEEGIEKSKKLYGDLNLDYITNNNNAEIDFSVIENFLKTYGGNNYTKNETKGKTAGQRARKVIELFINEIKPNEVQKQDITNWQGGVGSSRYCKYFIANYKKEKYNNEPYRISVFFGLDDEKKLQLLVLTDIKETFFTDDDITKEKKQSYIENFSKSYKPVPYGFEAEENVNIPNSEYYKTCLIKRIDLTQNIENIVNETTNAINQLLNNYKAIFNEGDYIMDKNIPLNQILYGPPGTGKTYKIKKYIEKYIYPQIDCKNKDVVSYDDLLLNNDLSWAEKLILAYKLNNKDNKPLTDQQISELPFIQRWYLINNKMKNKKGYSSQDTLICSIRGEMQKNAIKENGGLYAEHKNNYFQKKKEGFVLIQDGLKCFKEICEKLDLNPQNPLNDFEKKEKVDISVLSKEYYTFCTFHQSYSYEDFVEGIKPVISKQTNDASDKKDSIGNIQYEYNDGIFKNMCTKAKKQPDKKFFIFIDEINRGNISKIFGELITLIEKDKREKVFDDGKEYNTIEVTLPYSQDKFTVPNNLYIIGTMNTADRSIASVDIALRRRFRFVEMMPQSDLLKIKIHDEEVEEIPVVDKDYTVNLKTLLETLNKRISYVLDDDHQIGHSYFLKLLQSKDGQHVKAISEEDLKDVFKYEILPLLNEYFYGDWDKIKAVLIRKAESNESIIDNSFIEEKETQTLSCYCGDKKQYRFKKDFNIQDAIKCIADGIIINQDND